MAQAHDYATAIMKWLSNDELGDYEGLARLAKLYRNLHPLEQQKLAEGLADAICKIEDIGVLSDAIHLAYHLELFTDSVARAVDSRKELRHKDRRLSDEIGNYKAYQAQPLVTPV